MGRPGPEAVLGKNQQGARVDWIGARFAYVYVDGAITGVNVTITPEKVTKLVDRANEMLATQFTGRGKAKEFAGLVAWIASVVKAMRPYSRMVWAAALAKPAGKETWDQLYTQRLRLPLLWLKAAAQNQLGSFHRYFPLASPPTRMTITFDASLEGGGATLSLGENDEMKVISFWRTTWTAADNQALEATNCDAKHQAAWEAYALLLALCTWIGHLVQGFRLTVRGDAQGVLQDVVKGRAKSAAINLLIAEIQLVLAPMAYDLTAIHWWSEHNHVCDALSRPDHQVPTILRQVARVDGVRRRWHFLRAEVRRELGYHQTAHTNEK